MQLASSSSTLCQYCLDKPAVYQSHDEVISGECVHVCSQACSDEIWKKARTIDAMIRQEDIGFSVSSDPGYLPTVPKDKVETFVQADKKIPYAPVHQWLTQEGVRALEKELTDTNGLTADYINNIEEQANEGSDDKIHVQLQFNYHKALAHYAKTIQTTHPELFTPLPAKDLEYYHFSARALVAGAIWNDVATLVPTDANAAAIDAAWKSYIDDDITTGDASYIRRLVKKYNLEKLTDRPGETFLDQEYHYNPAIHKLIALGWMTAVDTTIDYTQGILVKTIFWRFFSDLRFSTVVSATKFAYSALRAVVWLIEKGKKVADWADGFRAYIRAHTTTAIDLEWVLDTPIVYAALDMFFAWAGVGSLTGVRWWLATLAIYGARNIGWPASVIDDIRKLLGDAPAVVLKMAQSIVDTDVKYAQSNEAAQKWHSMARPENYVDTTAWVTNAIIQQLSTWFKDAIDTRSEFALGHILHCIEDSYSRSHTRRVPLTKSEVVSVKLSIVKHEKKYDIQVVRWTDLLGYQTYGVERNHAISDSWTAALGVDPGLRNTTAVATDASPSLSSVGGATAATATDSRDYEYRCRRDECISVLAGVCKLYYAYWNALYLVRSNVALTVNRIAEWKNRVLANFSILMMKGPYRIDETYAKRMAGGSYYTNMRPDVVKTSCEKRPNETDSFCYLPTPEERVKILENKIRLNVVVILDGKEFATADPLPIDIAPSNKVSDLKSAIRDSLVKLGRKDLNNKTMDLQYFDEEEFKALGGEEKLIRDARTTIRDIKVSHLLSLLRTAALGRTGITWTNLSWEVAKWLKSVPGLVIMRDAPLHVYGVTQPGHYVIATLYKVLL